MSITAKQVKNLRDATGMPMMKCKKALEAEGGDHEKAVDRLRKEGLKAAEVRSDRATAEGLVRVLLADGGARGTMVAVSCETDPVARTDEFQKFVERLTTQVDEAAPGDVETLLAQPWIDDASTTVDEVLRGLSGRIGENMQVSSFARLVVADKGLVGSYVHHTKKDGALIALQSDKADDALAGLAKQMCMHIVFAKPTALVREDVPASVSAKETEIARAQIEQDPKMAGKPSEVIDKIVEGKLSAFFKRSVLMEQDWAIDPSLNATVSEVLRRHGATVQAFERLQVGG